MEEIYDIIGRSYPYTYRQFLKEFTPRLAQRFIEIINIRENNQYCYNAMMHGHDMKKHLIKKEAYIPPKRMTEEDYKKSDESVANYLKKLQKEKKGE